MELPSRITTEIYKKNDFFRKSWNCYNFWLTRWIFDLRPVKWSPWSAFSISDVLKTNSYFEITIFSRISDHQFSSISQIKILDVVMARDYSCSKIFLFQNIISYLNVRNRESSPRASFFGSKLENPFSESKVMAIPRFSKKIFFLYISVVERHDFCESPL